MPHIGGRDAVLRQQVGLERKDAQHVVALRGSCPPAPARQAQMDGQTKCTVRTPWALAGGFEVEVEVGRVDADERRGPCRAQQTLAQRSRMPTISR
jgi:hypothetical protein